jgi:SAM-dependent methyltransferase
MSAHGVLAFVRAALPPPPARVLEVGAGNGELAAALARAGYDVVAIDPAAPAADDRAAHAHAHADVVAEGAAHGDPAPADRAALVRPVALLDLREPPASFDAAVAVVSLHHVEPLEPSCERLAALVRPGGRLVVDEFDVTAFDADAAAWWCDRRRELGKEVPHDPAAMVADLRDHLHAVERIRAALAPAFELSPTAAGPYLHRWDLTITLKHAEEDAIARKRLPAVGVRFTGVRR